MSLAFSGLRSGLFARSPVLSAEGTRRADTWSDASSGVLPEVLV